MNNYTIFLCLVVFFSLSIIFITLLFIIYNLNKKVILGGIDDEKIIKEFSHIKRKNSSKVIKVLDGIFLGILWLVLIVIFSANIFVAVQADNVVGNIPIMKTVDSGSMATKYEDNKYLFENNLNNQVQINDLVILRKLPAEDAIKLYDIILYEYKGVLIFHRVVAISEATPERNYRLFTFQGDAVDHCDPVKVRYSQMKGIYTNQRLSGVGLFIKFMQAPPGYLCLALAFVICIGGPVYIERLDLLKKNRYEKLITSTLPKDKSSADTSLLEELLDI